jgi:RNA polymerase sigma-70 factor (family 1)
MKKKNMRKDIDIVAFNRGESKEFWKIWDMYSTELIYFAKNMIVNVPEAEDIVIKVLSALFAKCKDFDSANAIDYFLYKSVKNRCLNYLNQKNVRSAHENQAHLTGPDDLEPVAMSNLVKTEIMKRLINAIPKLPRKCRKVFELHFFMELTHAEIADQLNIKVQNVTSQLFEAHKKLKRLIKKETFLF